MVKFLIVAITLIRIKILIFQYQTAKIAAFIGGFVWKIKSLHGYHFELPIGIKQLFMSNSQIKICHVNEFNVHITQKVHEPVYFV